MAAPHHSSLEDFDFKQKRRKVLDKKAIVTSPSTAADDVQFLEAFDLDYTFGPAAGTFCFTLILCITIMARATLFVLVYWHYACNS